MRNVREERFWFRFDDQEAYSCYFSGDIKRQEPPGRSLSACSLDDGKLYDQGPRWRDASMFKNEDESRHASPLNARDYVRSPLKMGWSFTVF